MSTYTSVNAASFVAGNLGVNTHLGDIYQNTAYGNLTAVRTAMNYIGFSNIRDDVANGELPRLQTLAGYGFHFDIGRDPLWISNAEFMNRIDQLQAAHPGAITSIEGMNEVDGWAVNYNGLTGVQGAIAEQRDLFNLVHADPLFAKTAIWNFTMMANDAAKYSALGNLSSIASAQPMHYYYGSGSVAGWWPVMLNCGQADIPGGGHVMTEIGSSTATSESWGVDETVQAKQTLDVFMNAARTNTKVFFYELADESHANTPLENNYGLFHSDWTPKPAATALHNVTTILTTGADPNAAPDSFSYTVSGLNANNGYTTVFTKSANVHDIAVWQEPNMWNATTHTEIANPANPVTVNLGATYASIDVYDPLVGTSPIQHITGASSVTVSVSDHPLIIEVNSGSGSTSGSVSGPIPTQSSGVTVSGADPAVYTGTANADTIVGADGANNALFGGDGADSITGGTGFDRVNGNKGDDVILGRSAAGDWLSGGQGNDLIDASASHGNNIANGNLGGDTLTGGAGADTLRGGQGDDVIHAGLGGDWISGDLGNNTIFGGQGMDTFHATAGHDSVTGWHAGDHVQVDSGVTFAVAQVNGDAHITFSTGGEMDLLNTQVSSLQAGWIVAA